MKVSSSTYGMAQEIGLVKYKEVYKPTKVEYLDCYNNGTGEFYEVLAHQLEIVTPTQSELHKMLIDKGYHITLPIYDSKKDNYNASGFPYNCNVFQGTYEECLECVLQTKLEQIFEEEFKLTE